MNTESSSFFIFPVISESYANVTIGHEQSECLQSAVYNAKRNWASTVGPPC